jgi:hypothetical protein
LPSQKLHLKKLNKNAHRLRKPNMAENFSTSRGACQELFSEIFKKFFGITKPKTCQVLSYFVTKLLLNAQKISIYRKNQ